MFSEYHHVSYRYIVENLSENPQYEGTVNIKLMQWMEVW